MRKQKTEFWESSKRNSDTYRMYFNALMSISVSRFKWHNLPETVDERFLELIINSRGVAVFFRDEVLGYLGLQCILGGAFNVYNIPTDITAIAPNGYQNRRTLADSVLIFNDYLHTVNFNMLEQFAIRLYEIKRAADVNISAQKTPILIQCEDNQKLSMKNVYQQYDGNAPVIFGYKNLDLTGIKVLKTDAPFVSDKLLDVFDRTWNEALGFLGISNISVNKKERLITDEVYRSMGGTLANRNSALKMRQQACEQINKLFGLNVSVEFDESLLKEQAGNMTGESAETIEEVRVDE